MVAVQTCQATMAMGFGGGDPMGHDGIAGRVAVTIMDGKRTIVGVCQYCHQAIIAQEPEYNTVLAPVRPHQRMLAKGVWQCWVTGIDHMAAVVVRDVGGLQFVCVDCDLPLTHYQWDDNLTGNRYDVFLHEYTIEEEPI